MRRHKISYILWKWAKKERRKKNLGIFTRTTLNSQSKTKVCTPSPPKIILTLVRLVTLQIHTMTTILILVNGCGQTISNHRWYQITELCFCVDYHPPILTRDTSPWNPVTYHHTVAPFPVMLTYFENNRHTWLLESYTRIVTTGYLRMECRLIQRLHFRPELYLSNLHFSCCLFQEQSMDRTIGWISNLWMVSDLVYQWSLNTFNGPQHHIHSNR